MELEHIPLAFGALVALAGLALIADGRLADPPWRAAERRRHARAERHRGGETAIGLGLVCAAAALATGDTWRYTTAAVLAAAVLVAAGALLNARFLAERLTHRGASRRGRAGERRRLRTAAPAGDPERRPHDRRVADRRDAPGRDAPGRGPSGRQEPGAAPRA